MSKTDTTGETAGPEMMIAEDHIANDQIANDHIEGHCLRPSGKDGPQLVECSKKSWNDVKAEKFLNALGASCNATYAVRASGMSKGAVYRRRRIDPGFAMRWQAALSQGYVRVEMLLIDNAERTLSGKAPDPDCPIPAMTVKEALNLLHQHQGAVHGNGNGRKKWNARPRDLEEVREAILSRLEAIANLPDEGDGE